MKTVITDNSLCALPIEETARPEHIYKYIQALGEAGIKYVQMDFRTIMRMEELPDGVGYIFSSVDPMFSQLADTFDFDYTLVSFNALQRGVTVKTPAIIQFPANITLSRRLIKLAEGLIHGQAGAARLAGDFPMMTPEEARDMMNRLKNTVTVPIDICPTNGYKNALDTALKMSAAGSDSVCMTMGVSSRYASFEEYLFSLMAVFGALPENYSMAALCKAAIYHKLVFVGDKSDSITHIMRLLDYDINHLTNTDTGNRVKMRITLRENQLLNSSFVSSMERMLDGEDIPDDIRREIENAVKYFDKGLFNEDILTEENSRKGLVN